MLLFRLALLGPCLALASAGSAQSLEGYVTGGAGRWVHSTGSSGPLLAAAGGAEWLATRHVGIGGEGGLLLSPSGDVAATLAVDARLHLLGTTPRGRWAPYVCAGYTPLRLFELSDQGAVVGAGLDYRLSARRAVRLEVRDLLRSGGSVRTHYWTVRAGLTFR